MNKTYDTPDDDIVLQEDDVTVDAIKVKIEGTVQTDSLPSRSGGTFRRSADTNGIKLLNVDPRRKSATIISLDQDIYVGNVQGDVMAGPGTQAAMGARWPVKTPLVLDDGDEWWIASVSETSEISVINRMWAR